MRQARPIGGHEILRRHRADRRRLLIRPLVAHHVKEQIIFPEIEYDKIDALRGMNISITTTAKTDEEARALLAAFRFPFKA